MEAQALRHVCPLLPRRQVDGVTARQDPIRGGRGTPAESNRHLALPCVATHAAYMSQTQVVSRSMCRRPHCMRHRNVDVRDGAAR